MNSETRENLVPIHPDNAKTNDWLVLLETATIVGHTRDKLRVALTTQDRKFAKKYRLFHKPQYFVRASDDHFWHPFDLKDEASVELDV